MSRIIYAFFLFLLATCFIVAQEAPNNSRDGFTDDTPPINIETDGGLLFMDDFNGDNTVSGLQARGWTVLNEDGGGTTDPYYQGSIAVFNAYEGPDTGYVASNFNGANASGIIDHWLISPEVTVNAGDTLRFWHRAPDGNSFDDSIYVKYSTTAGITPGDFDVTWGRYLVSETGWAQWVGTFTTSGTIRFAIQYYIFDGGPIGTYSNYIGIDYLEVAGTGGGGGLGDHLLLTEVVVTPTAGEYVEIYNPTASSIDLTDYYLTDATFAGGGTYYYQLVEGGGGGGGFGDFYARFPAGAMIAPGEFQTISAPGSQDFLATYGMLPTYELFEDSTAPDGVPDMLEATSGSINGQGGITNAGEVMVLLKWDGLSDLVEDVDYVVWGDKVEAIDKSGVLIDGPDANTDSSMYLNDTPIPAQDSLPTGHPIDSSFTRVDFNEGSETSSGGNGITGNDETSENLSVTWDIKTVSPNDGVIPVELVSFSASVSGTSVNLYWNTATEVNNGGFEIQRADESMNWKVIGFVEGNGTTTEPQTYSYTDNSSSGNGTYYYRLKQIDYNGLYQYSPSVEVVFGTPVSFELNQNFPNPFNPSTTISFRLPENSDVKLSIFNAIGEEVKVLVNKEMQAGFHNIRFNAAGLPSGVYFYKIQSDNFNETKKMMLLK